MPKAAIYVRAHLTPSGSIISTEDQETACRDYCIAKAMAVAATYADNAGANEQFERLIAHATGPDAPFDAIVVWKLNRFSMFLEETIELRDKLRRIGTRLVSTTEKGIDD